MKTSAISALRRKLAMQQSACGLWVTLDSPSMTEMAVALGLDYVVIDAEHSDLDWRAIAGHIRATVRSTTVAIVRLPERNTGAIKRALDLGADGIAVPGVETAQQLRDIVRDCRYPPEGCRGVGADRATVWGEAFAEHTGEANAHVLILPILESPLAHANIRELVAVDGTELFYIGPADYSATSGFLGQWEGPGVADEILEMRDVIRAADKRVGIIGTSHEDLIQRRDQGFQLLGLGTDAGLTLRGIRAALSALGTDRRPAASLDPQDAKPVAVPLSEVPADMKSDRRETLTSPGEGLAVTLADGVSCELLVGDFIAARNLSTGIVAMQPGAALPCHAHPCTESITVLAGEIDAAVEGRVYRLRAGDNIVVPRWLPHAVRNPDPALPSRVHVAFGMSVPLRTAVTHEFREERMPDDCSGRPGGELITRLPSARKYAAGPNTEFVDYFNEKRMPGIEMSGGWARFAPGGRLPAHFHDFDESICIIDGVALCRVCDRQYDVSGCATVCVPRGRPHYFINESQASMTMVWVYAGPLPERIIVTDECLSGAD